MFTAPSSFAHSSRVRGGNSPSSVFQQNNSANFDSASSIGSQTGGWFPAFGGTSPGFPGVDQSASSLASTRPLQAFGSWVVPTPCGSPHCTSPFAGTLSTTPEVGNACFGQSGFGWGSKKVPYSSTSHFEGDYSTKFQSISAMPVYKEKSHEELRCEDYLLGTRGRGPSPNAAVGQSPNAFTLGVSPARASAFTSSSPSNSFSTTTPTGPFVPSTPAEESTPSSVFGPNPAPCQSSPFITPSTGLRFESTPFPKSQTSVFGVNTSSTSTPIPSAQPGQTSSSFVSSGQIPSGAGILRTSGQSPSGVETPSPFGLFHSGYSPSTFGTNPPQGATPVAVTISFGSSPSTFGTNPQGATPVFTIGFGTSPCTFGLTVTGCTGAGTLGISGQSPFGVGTQSPFGTSSLSCFGSSPSIFGSTPPQGSTPVFNISLNIGGTQSSPLFQSTAPLWGQPYSSFGRNPSALGPQTTTGFGPQTTSVFGIQPSSPSAQQSSSVFRQETSSGSGQHAAPQLNLSATPSTVQKENYFC